MNIASPDGWCVVYGPSCAAMALRRRMLPKVPRIITSWWPRRAPEGVDSPGGTPRARGPRAGRAPGRDRARRGDVVGGHRVAQQGKGPGAGDVRCRSGLGAEIAEERRAGDVRGGW